MALTDQTLYCRDCNQEFVFTVGEQEFYASRKTGDNPSKPGDCVVFKAWIDCIAALSACPQEFNPVAGWYPTDLHVGIYAVRVSGAQRQWG